MTSKNDVAWGKLFADHNILKKIIETGQFIITSKQINKYRESRLMTKFDHKINLPEIFKKNDLAILPLTRGSYIIAKFEAYKQLNYSADIVPILVPKRADLESLDYNNIYSESAAVNCAFASGIIRDVLGEDCYLTVNGRMSSKSFDFSISETENNSSIFKEITVKNSQCEIDAGFESETKLALLEVKNTSCEDFLIRQIYYPYRLWKNKISKKIVPIFMTYSNDIFSFFIYDFDEPNNYNSLRLVEQKNYVVAPEEINVGDIKEILKNSVIVDEPKIPFPQADSFDRIIDFLGLLVEQDLSKEEITINYAFDKRQTDYYFNAGRYLGLTEKFVDGTILKIRLTHRGREIMAFNSKEKKLSIIKEILKHGAFNKSIKLYFNKSESPSTDEIVEIMKKSNLYSINSDSTYGRRSRTVLKWVNWILDLTNR